ncbi:RyR domain-containing protein [Sinomonas cyclohexanicum]|uniref:RyR domain-containing protein n=1 Tax=Sinomonas cyclohexanicum TaxID=322009 RepID=UPI001E4B6798|nr:RyR domain-containing protein [Corynebacterium cyclohexanicum]
MTQLPRNQMVQIIRLAIAGAASGVFLAAVLLWTVIGFVPELAGGLPEPLAEFGAPGAWWPLAVLIASIAVGLLTAKDLLPPSVPLATVAVGACGSAAALMGVAGYWPCSGDQSPGWTALRRTFDIFGGTMETPFGQVRGCPSAMPLGLQASRILALSAIVILAAKAISLLFSSGVHAFRARQAKHLVLFAGLSDETLPVAKALRLSLTEKEQLILVSAGEDPQRLHAVAREIGALALALDVGDRASVQRFLGSRRPGCLRGVYLMYTDNALNLRAMDHFLAASSFTDHTSEIPGRLVVRIDNSWHAEDWRRTAMTTSEGWLLDAVSCHELAARHTVQRLQEENIDQVIVSGTSAFELAVLAELAFQHRVQATVRHSRAAVVPRATIAGPRGNEIAAHFAAQLERFGIRSHPFLESSGEPIEHLMARDAVALLQSGDGEGESTFLAARHPSWRILVWDETVRGVSARLVGGMSKVGPTFDPVPGQGVDIWDWLGRIAHQRYLAIWRNGTPTVGDSVWGRWDEDLSAFTKESNIRSFVSVSRALGRMGRVWATRLGTAPSSQEAIRLTDDEMTSLARMEHDSWLRHHEEYGWSYAEERNDRLKRHPMMIPWEELDLDARRKDVEAVQGAIELFTALGFVLAQSSATPGA